MAEAVHNNSSTTDNSDAPIILLQDGTMCDPVPPEMMIIAGGYVQEERPDERPEQVRNNSARTASPPIRTSEPDAASLVCKGPWRTGHGDGCEYPRIA